MKFQVTRRPWYHKDRPAWMVWPMSDDTPYPMNKIKELSNNDIEICLEAEDERYALLDGKFFIEKYIKENQTSIPWRRDFGQI